MAGVCDNTPKRKPESANNSNEGIKLKYHIPELGIASIFHANAPMERVKALSDEVVNSRMLYKGTKHRRKMNIEEKAKVVAAVWGT